MATNFLQHRMLNAPFRFLCAIDSGPGALGAFADEWDALVETLNVAIDSSGLSPSDLALAQETALKLAALQRAFSELDAKADQLASTLLVEVMDLLSRWSLDDRPHLERGTLPTVIPHAYAWLLDHIQDPYPSATVKRSLSKCSNTSLSKLDRWFKDVRKCVGWVALCKSHFRGSRTLITEAAFQAFVCEDAHSPLAPHIRTAFLDIKSRLETLSSPKIDCNWQLHDVHLANTSKGPNTIRSTHCPRTLSRLSPTPSLVSCSSDESDVDDLLSERWKPITPVERTDDRSYIIASPERSVDRLKALIDPPFCRTTPSPCSHNDSIAPLFSRSDSNQCNASPVDQVDSVPASSVRVCRKRRLSESDTHGSPKRPRVDFANPRLHSVSDPLPRPGILNTKNIVTVGDLLNKTAEVSTPQSAFPDSLPPQLTVLSLSQCNDASTGAPDLGSTQPGTQVPQHLVTQAPDSSDQISQLLSLFEPVVPSFPREHSTPELDLNAGTDNSASLLSFVDNCTFPETLPTESPDPDILHWVTALDDLRSPPVVSSIVDPHFFDLLYTGSPSDNSDNHDPEFGCIHSPL